MFFFSSWDFNGLLFWMFFVILCFQIGYNIFKDLFLKLALHMSCIGIFCKIMSPFMDRRHDKVTYMLCIFKCTLSGGWINYQMIVLVLLSLWDKKIRVIGNWYLLIVNVLEVFDSKCDGDIRNSLILVLLVWHF
jgi:hypothetical protein